MVEEKSTVAMTIADELKVEVVNIEAAIRLLDEGATIPFIARFRKEEINGLNCAHLRSIAERLHYFRDLNERRGKILQLLQTQEKLTPSLEAALNSAVTKISLEDLYLPYRPKHQSKAQNAREAGLAQLAYDLWKDPSLEPESHALQFINPIKAITDVKLALMGAAEILIEEFSQEPAFILQVRDYLWQHLLLNAMVKKQKNSSTNKFSDYFNYKELLRKIPSHHALALLRGRRDGVLQLTLSLPLSPGYGEHCMQTYFNVRDEQRPADNWLINIVRIACNTRLLPKLELELLNRMRESAEDDAILVCAHNLRELLLSAPAGNKVVMGLDPSARTGIKVAVVDVGGMLLDYTALNPFPPQNDWYQSIGDIAKLVAKYNVQLISIGNGKLSKETGNLVSEVIKMYPDLNIAKTMVNEAGASAYATSVLADKELPDLDVTFRGAVSLARRLQEPMAELVKIEPKAIVIGQYQCDVNQTLLSAKLSSVIVDCVNEVGVNVNTASSELLSYVSGLNLTLAENLVQYREEHGNFINREQLKNIACMSDKIFQQTAGFLRITNGDNPLDATHVHPEDYAIIYRILADKNLSLKEVLGKEDALEGLDVKQYADESYSLLAIADILLELQKPSCDPRPEFKTVHFKEGIEDINDLQEDMILEGVVSNVTNFGAFVDIGVHQDGLVHISAMTEKFISSPHNLVKTGDIIKVKVISIDIEKRRIGLSMKLLDAIKTDLAKKSQPFKVAKKAETIKGPKIKAGIAEKKVIKKSGKASFNTAMADALAKLTRGVA